MGPAAALSCRWDLLKGQGLLDTLKAFGNSPRLPDANAAQTMPLSGPRPRFC